MSDENQTVQAEPETPAPDPQAEAAACEYPAYFGEGAALPEEVTALQTQGMGLLEALRLYDLKQTKETVKSLKAELEAERVNHRNAAASTGSAASGEAFEKDYFTPQEWDNLPKPLREKMIRSGKIFEFMKKWNGI